MLHQDFQKAKPANNHQKWSSVPLVLKERLKKVFRALQSEKTAPCLQVWKSIDRESHDPKLTVTVKKYLFRKVGVTSLFTCTCPSCHLYQSRQRCDAPAVWGPLGLLCGPLWGLVGPLDGLRGPRVPTAPASLCARPDLKQAGGNRISWCSHCVLKE